MYIPRIILLIVFIAPACLHAQVVSLSTEKTSYTTQDTIRVAVSVNTEGKHINTISGHISIPTNLFSVSDIRSGNSIVSLWIEQPAYSEGEISFTGGIPGGYGGSSGPLFSFFLIPKKTGQGGISLSGIKMFLNDGLATEIKATNKNITLSISGSSKTSREPIREEDRDTISPEPFFPLIGNDSALFDNKYFVSFSTVDKDSGISHYEVREIPTFPFGSLWATDWEIAETPHVLFYQKWLSKVLVRAIDTQGNVREVSVVKPFDGILVYIVLFTMSVYWFFRKGFVLKKRIK